MPPADVLISNCTICPRKCNVNRSSGRGYCNAPDKIKINLSQLHFGEEPVISGKHGSGTVFFSHCNLSCVYCQNYLISQEGHGKYYSVQGLSALMLDLQDMNAHNINLVTPTHYTTQVIDALQMAKKGGLSIPVIWNSNAYEEVETLKKLDGLVDIYLPDFKYSDPGMSGKYSHAPGYPEIAGAAVKEMYWQTGCLKVENDLATRGVMIRVLILPHDINNIGKTLEWINKNFGTDIYISLMSQYYPAYHADRFPEISRGITKTEHEFAVEQFYRFGFCNGFIQGISCSNKWTPEFNQ